MYHIIYESYRECCFSLKMGRPLEMHIEAISYSKTICTPLAAASPRARALSCFSLAQKIEI